MNSFLQIHPEDNALVALQNLPKNKTIQFKNDTFALQNDIEDKHKFGMKILKYIIGLAGVNIIHTQ